MPMYPGAMTGPALRTGALWRLVAAHMSSGLGLGSQHPPPSACSHRIRLRTQSGQRAMWRPSALTTLQRHCCMDSSC